MAANPLVGAAALWGIATGADLTELADSAGTVIAGQDAATLAGIIESADYTRGGKEASLMNEFGDTVGEAHHDKRIDVSVVVTPADRVTTFNVSAAATNATALTPAKGSILQIIEPIHANFTSMDGLSTKFIVDQARVRTTNQSFVQIEIDMHKFEDNEITNTVAA